MADIKRLHYFDHQFLVEADFSDEQTYHLDMRRRHNRDLHTFGVAAGLQVEKTGDKEVTVSAGTAVDREGRQVVLDTDQIIDLSTFSAGDIYITIAYDEQETDPTTATGVTGNTRVTETPQIQAINVPPGPAPPGDGSVIRLANFTLTGGGNVPGSNGNTFDAGLRQYAGSSIAPDSVGTNQLANSAVTQAKISDNAVTTAKIADNAITAAKIADNAITAAKIADLSISAADLANNSISENKLDAAARAKLVTNGNTHDHAGGDGAQIRHGTLNMDDGTNPHHTSAADVGALVSVDGVQNPGGNVDLVAGGSITIAPDNGNNRITIGENHSSATNNPHGVTAAQTGALTNAGGTIVGSLDVRRTSGSPTARLAEASGTASNYFGREPGKNQSVFISAQEGPNVSGGTQACLFIWPVVGNVQSLYLSAASGVDTMTVNGTARFTGSKIGYIVDTFVNASGKTLHTGDIVKLKSTGVVRFQGDNNLIPITEVTLADQENDPLVIGIVGKEATPPPDEPDTRSEPDDPTFIPDGGELFVVTLGTFAHCRVDASAAPIEVGDLLTSSGNPGHAQKAIDPRIGSIIGKALEPLKEGTGYISVFVNIQ